MSKRLFLVHWKEEEAAEWVASLQGRGWHVDTEFEDGGRAVRRIRKNPPDAVLISLSRLPSHGRATAQALQSSQVGLSIPIIFLDGSGEKLDAIRLRFPDAIFISSASLGDALERGFSSSWETDLDAPHEGEMA